MQHILVAVDLTQNSNIIIKKAQQLAKLYSAKLSLLHVANDTAETNLGEFSIEIDDNLLQNLKQKSSQQMQQLCASHEISESCCHTVIGNTVDLILEKALELNADLLVIGAFKKTGLQRLLGSNAYKIMQQSAIDTLIIKN